MHSFESCSRNQKCLTSRVQNYLPYSFCEAHGTCPLETSASQADKILESCSSSRLSQCYQTNGSKSDSETCHLAGVVTLKHMYPPCNRHFFHNVGQWEKVSSGQGMPPDVISHSLGAWCLPAFFSQRQHWCVNSQAIDHLPQFLGFVRELGPH